MASGDEKKLRLDRFLKALAALDAAMLESAQIPRAILRDSRIQRFEFTFEALWKLLRTAALADGLEAASPRKALQAAIRLGLLDPTDEERAWELLRYRNLTVHTYNEDLANEVECFIVGPALSLFRKIASRSAK